MCRYSSMYGLYLIAAVYDSMKVLVSQKMKKEIKLLLGTNSLMSSYIEEVTNPDTDDGYVCYRRASL